MNASQFQKELKFVNPKNEVAFRKIFGDENKNDIGARQIFCFVKAIGQFNF